MISIKMTTNRRRQITAACMAVVLIIIFFIRPDLFSVSDAGVPAYAAYFLPLFLLLAMATILLELHTESQCIRYAFKIAVLLICLLAVFYLCEALVNRHFWYLFYFHFKAFFYGYLILFFMTAGFFALSGSMPWALRITTIIIFLYSIVNYFVTLFRGTPFIPMDVFGAATAANIIEGYVFGVTKEIVEAILAAVGVFLIAPRLKLPLPDTSEVYERLPAKVKEKMSRVKGKQSKRSRIPALSKDNPSLFKWFVRSISLLAAAVFFLITLSRWFVSVGGYEPDYWNQSRSIAKNGSFVNFVSNIPESFFTEPAGYSLSAVNEIASRYTSDSVSDAKEKPDVILILGESWADMAPEGFVKTDVPVLPFMSGMAGRSDSIFADLIVSTAGGGTSKSEFQVFTGTNALYGFHAAPFEFNVKEPIPNLTESFKQLGYKTTAMHTGYANSWGREEAFPLMGFDQFLSYDDFPNDENRWLRNYMRDSALYNKTLEILDDAQEPTFTYIITIAGHGSYDVTDYESTVRIEEPSGHYPKTEQYLSVMQHCDEDLKDFILELEKREKPTLVLFFGDHIPTIDDVYLADVDFSQVDPLWIFKTFYGVWANYELPDSPLTSSKYLGLTNLNFFLMQNAELPLTGYQKFLLEGALQYPVASFSGLIDPKGEELPHMLAENTDMYREQAIMQYNLVFDRKNLPEDFFYLKE